MLQQPASARRAADRQSQVQMPSSARSPAAPFKGAADSSTLSALRGGQDVANQPPQPERSDAKGAAVADDLDALLDRLQLASGRSSAAQSVGTAGADLHCNGAGGWLSRSLHQDKSIRFARCSKCRSAAQLCCTSIVSMPVRHSQPITICGIRQRTTRSLAISCLWPQAQQLSLFPSAWKLPARWRPWRSRTRAHFRRCRGSPRRASGAAATWCRTGVRVMRCGVDMLSFRPAHAGIGPIYDAYCVDDTRTFPPAFGQSKGPRGTNVPMQSLHICARAKLGQSKFCASIDAWCCPNQT